MICDRNDNGICKSPWCYHKSAGGTCLNPRFKFNPTNADRIRGMTDEEFAKIIAAEIPCELIPFCKEKPECMATIERGEYVPDEMCIECAIDWLQQPAKE